MKILSVNFVSESKSNQNDVPRYNRKDFKRQMQEDLSSHGYGALSELDDQLKLVQDMSAKGLNLDTKFFKQAMLKYAKNGCVGSFLDYYYREFKLSGR